MPRKTPEPRVKQLHEHLVATRERPIEREANRWIGEADAIADDLVDARISNLDPPVIEKRIGHVAELLSNIEETGDSTADEHVEAARNLANAILDSNSE
ncbi:hypothetical protein OB905_12125 [Halobacteria archaeon AArc-dxtr1]|nr:hypothetical protein [Halobacteria archaeon AArc-dxtr1]